MRSVTGKVGLQVTLGHRQSVLAVEMSRLRSVADKMYFCRGTCLCATACYIRLHVAGPMAGSSGNSSRSLTWLMLSLPDALGRR